MDYLHDKTRLRAKTCSKCGEIKPITCFTYKSRKKGTYNSFCKECLKKRDAERYLANKEQYNSNSAKYYQANKEAVLQRTAQYYLEHKEWYNSYMSDHYRGNKDSYKARHSKYRKDNPAYYAAAVVKYQTKKLNALVAWADLEAIEAFYTEARRLTLETGVPHEVDHIIPLQGKLVSGLHVESNLQILTLEENRAKSNKFVP